ncbi:MAG: alanine--tRNA ligase [Bacteroidetes bacterium]|nr:MAG: alanine--tRNA ligase [Bacteroidota bacterium]
MNSKEIRKVFKDFFEAKKHQIVQSAPMVIKNDPTLMFTNAGMNQFKDVFLGNSSIKYSRIANSQKCLRVSGKHNDLEEVGHDTYHHTMFEMLGNWSFGDYFKEQAIDWAWELLVDVFKISKDRLYATVFEGSKDDGLDKDNEAFNFWKKYLPEDKIINGSKKDNFWEMGSTGPCGPCSEIHIDLRDEEDRKKVDAVDLINKDHHLVIEIWNLVFIQYNRKADNSLEHLPMKHVDTGMGFERLCMVIQDKKSNYDTDVFQPIIQEIAKKSGKKYGENEKDDIAMRVIADHLRAVSFAIADGQLPSNNKAGYVIRRILRRAVRYAYTFLNQKEPFINTLVPVLISKMGDAYKELIQQQQIIEKIITEEEVSFLRTLDVGIKLLDKIIAQVKKEKNNSIKGKDAFVLYDTYGFPLDLTQLILKENGLTVNIDDFNKEMEMQKSRSRDAAIIDTDDWIILLDDEVEEFVGYDYNDAEVRIARYRKIKIKNKELFQLVFQLTPFYGESGGQVGDTGYIEANGEKISIIDTKKENGLTIHITKQLPSNLNVKFMAVVNKNRRNLIKCNHSATHLLHYALRKTLGEHVEQKGSLVDDKHLRFDFSHFQKLTDDDITKVEQIVNSKIRENIPLSEKRNLPIRRAMEMGAMALFGEKYGDTVRVIQFDDSVELCGGTHVNATGEIGFFKIISETAIAAGIRRIEAISSFNAEQYINKEVKTLKQIKQIFNNTKDVVKSIEEVINENAQLKKKIEDFNREKVNIIRKDLVNKVQIINGINVVAETINIDSADSIKNIAFQLKNQIDNLYLVLGAEIKGKASLTVMISDNLVKEKDLHAGNIIREISKEIQGGGGGQAFYATAGGKNPNGLTKAIEKAKEKIK